MKYTKLLSVLFLVAMCCEVVAAPPEVRAAFDFRSRTFLKGYSAAGKVNRKAYYPRAKRLFDGSLLLVYMDGKFGWNIYSRRSVDDGLTWSEPVCVRHSSFDPDVKDTRCYACPDFVELPGGDILLAFQWRYNKGYADSLRSNESCGIELMRSSDMGRTFDTSTAREVFRGRCWEPSFVVLPSGEIELFFTGVQRYCHTALIRSFDGGHTWIPAVEPGKYDAEHISRSMEKGLSMNGMPVGVCLDGDRGIAVAMESMNGKTGGDITPLVVWSSAENNWRYDDFGKGDIGPDSTRKWIVHKDFVGFAPYMTKIADGLVALQSNGKFRGRGGMWLFVGDPAAQEFSEPSPAYGGWWGSIANIGTDTLLSTSNREYGPGGKYMGLMISKAYINRSMEVSGPLPRRFANGISKGRYDWFVGAASQAQAVVGAGMDKRCMEIVITVRDNDIQTGTDMPVASPDGEMPQTDGVVISLGRSGAGTLRCVLAVTADGRCRMSCDGREASGCEVSGNLWNGTDGYRYVVRVPWRVLGGRPAGGESMKMFVRVLNLDSDGFRVDDMQGVNPTDSSSWLSVSFSGGACRR